MQFSVLFKILKGCGAMKSNRIKVKTCRKCKTPIHENSLQDYCSTCFKIVEEIFDKIREYLREYPGSTAFEIEQRLGIPVHVVNNFVRDGRLVEITNLNLNLQCLRCDGLLLSAHHKYCPGCEEEMMRSFQDAKDSLTKPQDKRLDGGKMRFKTYWD